MSNSKERIEVWAKKYALVEVLPTLYQNGFDTLEVISQIVEKDLDLMNITLIGLRKKNFTGS